MSRKTVVTVLIAMTIGVSYMSYGAFPFKDTLKIKQVRSNMGRKEKVREAQPTTPQGNPSADKQVRKQKKAGAGRTSPDSKTTDKRVQKSDQETNDKAYSANKQTSNQAKEQVVNEDKQTPEAERRRQRMQAKEQVVNEDEQTPAAATATATVQMPTPKTEDRPTYTAELQQKAESGDAAAQLDLALCYDFGSGIEKNPVEALKWFLKAAEQGNGRAQNAVGNYYANGTGGVNKNIEEALRWYRKSAEQECGYGQNSMGLCYEWGKGVEKDMEEAVRWYRKSAEQGCANGQNCLGNCYLNGKGVGMDVTEALKWFCKSAAQGNPVGQLMLGLCCCQGQGVKMDLAEAVKWFRVSAEQGNAYAQHLMGACYNDGSGVEKDMAEAAKWYRKSAEQGNAMAQARLGLCYQSGSGIEKDMVEAIKWYRKSAEQGDNEGQALLGNCYFRGYGVKGDMDEAFKWFSKSAKQGNEIAKEMLQKPEFSLVRVARGSVEDIEAGEACLQKLKEFKKDSRFSVEVPAPHDKATLVIKGLYVGMPIDDAVVACGKMAAASDDFLVADSRMIETDAWANCKAFKSVMKNCDGVCVLSSKNIDNIQDATKLCVVRQDGDGKVRQIFFTRAGISDVFKSSDLSTEEFAKALQDNYPKISSLEKTVKDKRENGADIREYRWRCVTGGCNVELYENTVLVDDEEINLQKYKSIMANDPNAFGVAIGEGLFSKYFCIDVKAKKSNGSFD